ncbi:hypothetical protein C4K03_0289 [Pseudomonas synxantha]|uniref:Uncharacterized protein n=1 Tax=Pseudomonas synxantha TaxID=47883 RepID=A0A3G7TZE2_9PSED|nr:hypothetical protein C4K03_0289 [Pseudomonas synxantha]
MVVSHRRWAQSYAGIELSVNFVNRLYLGDIRLSSGLKHCDQTRQMFLITDKNTLGNKSYGQHHRE